MAIAMDTLMVTHLVSSGTEEDAGAGEGCMTGYSQLVPVIGLKVKGGGMCVSMAWIHTW